MTKPCPHCGSTDTRLSTSLFPNTEHMFCMDPLLFTFGDHLKFILGTCIAIWRDAFMALKGTLGTQKDSEIRETYVCNACGRDF